MNCNFYLSPKGDFPKVLLCTSYNAKKAAEKPLYTPLRIAREDWDEQKMRPKNIYLKKYKKLYAKQNEIKIDLAKYAEDCKEQNKALLRKEISAIIQNFCRKDAGQRSLPKESLLYLVNDYIKTRKEMIRKSTLKRYHVFLRLLENFEGHQCKRYLLQEVNTDFMADFLAFCKYEEYGENTIYRSLNFVRTVLNFAEKRGIRTFVREIEVRRDTLEAEPVTLTEAELEQLQNTEMPLELKAAKDWLLISCYTGQRISDFMNFSATQIRKLSDISCIEFRQVKTGKKILLPLHPVVLSILEENGNDFPPRQSPTKYNFLIKKVAEKAGINNLLYSSKRLSHRVHNAFVEKFSVITSHIGRRSFATNFYGKIPTPLLMQATGHSTKKMFLKYIGSIDYQKTITLGRYFENDLYKNNDKIYC